MIDFGQHLAAHHPDGGAVDDDPRPPLSGIPGAELFRRVEQVRLELAGVFLDSDDVAHVRCLLSVRQGKGGDGMAPLPMRG